MSADERIHRHLHALKRAQKRPQKELAPASSSSGDGERRREQRLASAGIGPAADGRRGAKGGGWGAGARPPGPKFYALNTGAYFGIACRSSHAAERRKVRQPARFGRRTQSASYSCVLFSRRDPP